MAMAKTEAQAEKGFGLSDPFDSDEDNTMDKMACIEEMISRMEDMPSPSEIFLKGVLSEIKKDDIHQMVEAQNHMLSRFEKTNEMLLNFNSLSSTRFEATHTEFKRHTHLLIEMKKDLDSVFKRIRKLKSKLAKQHPEAFNAVAASSTLREEEEEEQLLPQRAATTDSPRLRRPKPPRPSQPPMRRASSSSPARNTNRHSWAGPPTTPAVAADSSPSSCNTPSVSAAEAMSKSESAASGTSVDKDPIAATTDKPTGDVDSQSLPPPPPKISQPSENIPIEEPVTSNNRDKSGGKFGETLQAGGGATGNETATGYQRQQSAEIVMGEADE